MQHKVLPHKPLFTSYIPTLPAITWCEKVAPNTRIGILTQRSDAVMKHHIIIAIIYAMFFPPMHSLYSNYRYVVYRPPPIAPSKAATCCYWVTDTIVSCVLVDVARTLLSTLFICGLDVCIVSSTQRWLKMCCNFLPSKSSGRPSRVSFPPASTFVYSILFCVTPPPSRLPSRSWQLLSLKNLSIKY